MTSFSSPDASHRHSLETLNLLYEHDDFMDSIETLADMGSGSQGLDIEWWATRTTRDELPRPLNIKCTAIDKFEKFGKAHDYRNISYLKQDFENPIGVKTKFDVVWCHDAFQFVIDPFKTLSSWYHAMNENGMLCIIVPQYTNLEFNVQAYDQPDYVYWNWTLVSLMHVLALSGFDCASGFFKKSFDDNWLHAVVYKSEYQPRDPRTTQWIDLANDRLLPETAMRSLERYGQVRQRDLVLPWLDHNLTWYGKQ